MTVAIMLGMVVVAPRVINRFGFNTPIVAGMLLLAARMAVMSLVRPDGNFVVDVLPASVLPPPASAWRSSRGLPRPAGIAVVGALLAALLLRVPRATSAGADAPHEPVAA